MNVFFHHLSLCAPLFLMVFLGWALVKIGMFSHNVTKALSQFVFKLLMPVMLFHLMSDGSNRPPVDWKVLIAFFGSCVVVYIIGNFLGGKLFRQDSTGRVITGMGGIFGNNVQLGVPIVQTSLGTAAMPTISLLIIFNVLLLWTSATACVEFGRTGGKIDWKKFLIALKNIFKNPLIVVGMGLAEHSFTAALPKASVITALKLGIQPFLVWVFCVLLGLDSVQTNAATVLACLPVAINLYIMATQFESEEGAASNAIFVSTFISALTVPLTLTLLGVGY